MSRFLLVIAVFIVVYLLMRNHARRRDAATWRDSAAPGGAPPPGPAAKPGEDMVRCGVCGVHLPKSEAVTSRGDFFCGNEHLQLADRERGKR